MEARRKTGPLDLCPQLWLLGSHYCHVLLLQTKMIKPNAAEITEIKRQRAGRAFITQASSLNNLCQTQGKKKSKNKTWLPPPLVDTIIHLFG